MSIFDVKDGNFRMNDYVISEDCNVINDYSNRDDGIDDG